MPRPTGEVVASPGERMPFAVVIRSGGAIIGRIGVQTSEAGKAILARLVRVRPF
ncbi:MAG: hypothetical protein ABW128_07405 [Rhizorhabdus sp.]